MKKSIDFSFDDHPKGDEERPRTAWAISVVDDCDGCEDIRVELTLEEEGAERSPIVAHLSPQTARRLRAGLASALTEVGEPSD
jgi:hypothetical protein